MEASSTLADENSVETITKYTCGCGCCQTVDRERLVSKVEKHLVTMACSLYTVSLGAFIPHVVEGDGTSADASQP